MAYNNRNLLVKIVEIQNIYLQHKEEGVTGEFIYHKIIRPNYFISRATFYKYLRRNAKKELRYIDSNK